MAQSEPGASSARDLYRALRALDAAPRADPVLRPGGAREEDAALLLGVLLGKVELDAAVRADPGQEPPDGLLALLTGFRALIAPGRDLNEQGEDVLWRLLSLRLVRTASEITAFPAGEAEGLDAAADAALAAANLLNAQYLDGRSEADVSAPDQALESAAAFARSAYEAAAQERGRHVLERAQGGLTSTGTGASGPVRAMTAECVAHYLQTLSRVELHALATRTGVRGRSTMTREQLRAALTKQVTGAPPPTARAALGHGR